MSCDEETGRIFNQLKPTCVAVAKNPTRANIQDLHKQLKSVDKKLIQDLQEYVIFPLRLVFKQVQIINQDVYCDTFECLKFVIEESRINNWQMFQDLFSTFFCMLSPPHESLKAVAISEELKLALLTTVSTLIQQTEWSTAKMMYEPTSLPALGHAVSALLYESEVEKSRDLQTAAISCLMTLTQSHRKAVRSERILLGDVFASFLPGITMSLARVISGDQKQGHVVLVKAIECWSKITCLVMSDVDVNEEDEATQSQKAVKVDDKIKNLMVNRTEEWKTSTASKLLILIKQIQTVKTNSNWRVRLALVEWADVMLQKCSKSMSECVPSLLEVLIGFIGDDYENIRNKSLQAVTKFKERQSSEGKNITLQEMLSENLHMLTTSLPRQIRMADEDEKLAIVNLLNGYLTLLGRDINQTLRSTSHLRRLTLSLVQTLELDCSDVKILEHNSQALVSGGIPSDDIITLPRKNFKHFRHKQVEEALVKTCSLLGKYGDVDLLVDHMTDIFHKSRIYELQSILIINNIMIGVKNRDDSYCVLSIVRTVVEEFLSDECFNRSGRGMATARLPSSSQVVSGTGKPETLANMNHDVMKTCLFVEGIGVCAMVCEEEFEEMLMDVVYPLLEKLGDNNTYISHTTYHCLLAVCSACHYSSIDELIRKNGDYLVDAISLKLRRLCDEERALLVLQVMLQYSSVEILPVIDDTINEVLENLDDHFEEKARLFLEVLKELVTSVWRWFGKSYDKENEKPGVTDSSDGSDIKTIETKNPVEGKEVKGKHSIEEIEAFFIDYHKTKQIAEGDVVNDGDGDDKETAEEEETDNAGEKDLPFHITAVKEVLTRTKHLLSSRNPRLQLLVLDIVQQSVIILSHYTDELLPLFHQIWVPLSLRFSDEEKLVRIKAMETLRLMSNYKGDFLMKRTMKDVLPAIKQFLLKQASISCNTGQSYTFTVNYKLQQSFLLNLGHIAIKMQVQSTDIMAIFSCCSPYLSHKQPKSLQQACVELMKCLIKLDADIIWFLLNNLYSNTAWTVPSPVFITPQFKKNEKENEYTSNVKELLPLTDQMIDALN